MKVVFYMQQIRIVIFGDEVEVTMDLLDIIKTTHKNILT
jgi:hypothetical protein